MAGSFECPSCYGTGRNREGGPCSKCAGAGVVGRSGLITANIILGLSVLIVLVVLITAKG